MLCPGFDHGKVRYTNPRWVLVVLFSLVVIFCLQSQYSRQTFPALVVTCLVLGLSLDSRCHVWVWGSLHKLGELGSNPTSTAESPSLCFSYL